jgi:pyruvate dehydrogenase E2 component (dihydrolipoamide acetyltransferase)
MPSLGADMEEGALYDWRVKPGDQVKRGDIVAAVETDKGVIDIEVFEDGIVDDILIAAGTRVPVGTVLALILAEGEEVVEIAVPAAETHPMDQRPLLSLQEVHPVPAQNGGRLRISPVARKRATELGLDLAQIKGTGTAGAITLADIEQAVAPAPTVPEEPERVRISPVARRMAIELGIDLNRVKGTGPHGAISRADVEQAAAAMIQQRPRAAEPKAEHTPTSPAPPSRLETADSATTSFQSGMRRAIAAAMSRANRDIPHYYLETRIDMSHTLHWLEAENQKRSLKERILPVVLLIKATAKALGDVPDLNGYWVDDQLQVQEAIHIGFAVALRQGGLVTPAIHHADLKSLDELMEAVRDLITRTRSGRLRSSELTDATITLTNLGDTGVEKVYGVIYPPQVALVGFGKVVEQTWVEKGMIGIRPVLTATLAGDHRATDGRIGAQFLTTLDNYLQEPEKL